MFDYSGNLRGIMVAVTGDSVGGTEAFFGQETRFANIASYKTAIETAIGASLIPEPSTVFLLVLGLATSALVRRRRETSAKTTL